MCIEIPSTAERGMNVILRLYCRRRCVDMPFAGIPVLIVAVGFAIKTEVYDGRDDDCVFRYKLPVSVIPRLHDEAGSTSWLYERSSSQLVEPASSCKRGIKYSREARTMCGQTEACNNALRSQDLAYTFGGEAQKGGQYLTVINTQIYASTVN